MKLNIYSKTTILLTLLVMIHSLSHSHGDYKLMCVLLLGVRDDSLTMGLGSGPLSCLLLRMLVPMEIAIF